MRVVAQRNSRRGRDVAGVHKKPRSVGSLVVTVGRQRCSLQKAVDGYGSVVSVGNRIDRGISSRAVSLRTAGKDLGLTGCQRKRIDTKPSVRGALQPQ